MPILFLIYWIMFPIDAMTKKGEIRTDSATGDRYIFNGTAWVAYTPAAEIDDGSITTAKLANGSVTTDKLGTDAVTEAKLTDDAVSTDKIVDAAVTATKLAP